LIQEVKGHSVTKHSGTVFHSRIGIQYKYRECIKNEEKWYVNTVSINLVKPSTSIEKGYLNKAKIRINTNAI